MGCKSPPPHGRVKALHTSRTPSQCPASAPPLPPSSDRATRSLSPHSIHPSAFPESPYARQSTPPPKSPTSLFSLPPSAATLLGGLRAQVSVPPVLRPFPRSLSYISPTHGYLRFDYNVGQNPAWRNLCKRTERKSPGIPASPNGWYAFKAAKRSSAVIVISRKMPTSKPCAPPPTKRSATRATSSPPQTLPSAASNPPPPASFS